MACYLPLWLLYLISFWSTSVFLLDSLLNMRNNKQAQKIRTTVLEPETEKKTDGSFLPAKITWSSRFLSLFFVFLLSLLNLSSV